MKTIPAFLLQLLSISVSAQMDNAVFENDTLQVTSYMELVSSHHPMAMQARLIRKKAESERIKASGSFDPKVYTRIDQKYFDDQVYYRLHDYGVNIPAWYGLSVNVGYEINDGVYLNPQNNVPQDGLWYADVNLTLGRGLFIDDRRAMLKQARLMVDQADFQIELALNKLYYEALLAYWEWYEANAIYNTYADAVKLAMDRMEGIRRSAELGEIPFIDTLEASIQWQTRQLMMQEAQANLITARQHLETYLWLEGKIPLELNDAVVPQKPDRVSTPELEEYWLANHPAIRSFGLTLDQLEIAQQWNKERLKPQLDINYQFLNAPVANADFFSNYTASNYTWGIGASFPLFLRKERAEIQKTEVIMNEVEYQAQLQQRQIANSVLAQQQELEITRLRLEESVRLVNNRQTLLNAELTKFYNGESSLFLINQREIWFLQSRVTQIGLEKKVHVVKAKLESTAAILD